MISCRVLLCLSAAFHACSAMAADTAWLTSGEYADLRIVLSPEATDAEKLAAEEFQFFWKKTTGCDVPVEPTPGDGVNVWIERDRIPEAYLEQVDFEELGTDGVCIRTFPESPGDPKALVLTGGRERGVYYAAYEFLERALGIRWLTPEATHIPEEAPEAIPHMDIVYAPKLQRRWMSSVDIWRNHGRDVDRYIRAHKLSTEPDFSSYRGHTFYRLVPPETYFEEHPEYYAMVDGERRAIVLEPGDTNPYDEKYTENRSQLCMSNPEVAEIIAQRIMEDMAAHPDKQIWGVAQMDWGFHCECPECTAIDEEQGSPIGSILTGVNRIADIVGEQFPDNYIHTFAYTYSRRSPKTLYARDNVIIELCSMGADFARPYTDTASRANRLFAKDVEGWADKAKHLMIWTYPVCYAIYHRPHPNLHVIQPNTKFFIENNVMGIFAQGKPSPDAELAAIRPYLQAKVYWNPDIDVEYAKNEFLDLYYQEAAPYVRQYIDLITHTILEKDAMMGWWDDGAWIDADMVVKAQALFDQALEAAKTDEIRRRVKVEQLAAAVAAMYCQPKVDFDGERLHLSRPECPTLKEYGQMLLDAGCTPETQVGEYALELNPTNVDKLLPEPPAREATYAINVLENDRHLVWVAPEYQGSMLRWRDKKLGIELFRGYENPGSPAAPGILTEFEYKPFQMEKVAFDSYEVVQASDDALTLRGRRDDGLLVERRMALLDDKIAITLTFKNEADEEVIPDVKLHPVFFTQGDFPPQIWGYNNDEWVQLNTGWDQEAEYGTYLDDQEYAKWGFYIAEKNLFVLNELLDYPKMKPLLYVYRVTPPIHCINIEPIQEQTPLKPGESRSYRVTYEAMKKPPF